MTYPVLFDALIVIEPDKPDAKFVQYAKIYVDETFRHFKPIWTFGPGNDYVSPDYAGPPVCNWPNPMDWTPLSTISPSIGFGIDRSNKSIVLSMLEKRRVWMDSSFIVIMVDYVTENVDG